MTKIPETFTIGDRADLTPEKLLELLELMYTQLAVAINRKPDIYEQNDVAGSVGSTSDTTLSNGDINIFTDTSVTPNTYQVEILVAHTDPATVIWKQLL